MKKRTPRAGIGAGLLAPAAHALRGSLTTIHGFSSFLAGRAPAGTQEAEILATVVAEAERGARLIGELVELFQLAASAGADFVLAPQAIAAILQAAVAAEGARLRLEVASGLPDVHVDAGRIRQALRPLVALAAARPVDRGEPLLIAQRAEQPEFIAIRTAFRPEAPEPTDLEQLFAPFQRSQSLALTRAITELHGGRVLLDRDPDDVAGVRVSVLLPLPN